MEIFEVFRRNCQKNRGKLKKNKKKRNQRAETTTTNSMKREMVFENFKISSKRRIQTGFTLLPFRREV